MNVFEAARQVDCISAAERLGIPVKRSGSKAYARCLFHADKTPSMYLYPGGGGFYCFGCHEHGDAIRLYAQALNLAPLEAAKRICADFGLSYVESGRRSLKRPTPPRATPRMDVRTLADKLVSWRERRVDELLARLRTAEATMLRIEGKLWAEGEPMDNAFDDPCWVEALTAKASAQDQIAELDGLSLPEIYQWMKEDVNDRGRNERPREVAG